QKFYRHAQKNRKKASTRQMILKRDVRGVITSIPLKRLALRGNMSTAAIAMPTPRAAANEHQSVAAAAVPAALVGGFADDTPATAVRCLPVSAIVITTKPLV